MRRSFLQLVVVSVLVAWLAGFVVLLGFAVRQSWTESRAEEHGVFLFFELLDETPPGNRQARLEDLERHTHLPLSLVSLEEATQRSGAPLRPGERRPHRVSFREEWYFFGFEDGQGALAIGPVSPVDADGRFPIGLVLAVIGLPAIAGMIAVRVERGINKVERATDALAGGKLEARVEDTGGPSAELATRFNAMAERVERLIRSRDELVQAVSHELGSPLSRLRFHMELLGNLSDDEREVRLSKMTRELDGLDALVAELLAYVQSDELKIDARTFNPKQDLADVAELAMLEAPADVALAVDTVLPDNIDVYADPRMFQRSVENLLRNAVRYAEHRVTLELSRDADWVRVAVHDDGPGIPEAQRDKVTAPFVRLEADRNPNRGGAGLGLAIVARIALRHGGRVEIGESRLGGACVSILWPPRESRKQPD
jgi:signal transduction histidine kinase